MKITFPLPTDGRYHQYCPKCFSENINCIFQDRKTFYLCTDCDSKLARVIVIDPKTVWWLDEKTKEYWHESVGVFVRNKQKKVLFFERTIYPFAFAIPAGHLDVGEKPEIAVRRELREETGIIIKKTKLFSEENVLGDKCRRGADNHKWHLYITEVDKIEKIKINDEGEKPVWLSLEEALNKKLVFPVKYFIQKYGEKLLGE